MINEKTLLNDWIVRGDTYEGFKDALVKLSDCTEFVKVDPCEVSVLSLKSLDEEKAHFWELAPIKTGEPQKDVKVRSLALDKVLERGDHKALLDETLNGVKVLFLSEGRVFFPADRVLSKGLVQFGAGGSAMDEPSYERDLYISSLFKNAKKRTFVVREISGVKKLVAILSARYKALPQSALCEIIDALDAKKDFGKMKVYAWSIDNWTSNIYIEYPEKADEISEYYRMKDRFVPGLWLQTSDTGDASIKIYPTWRRGTSISFVEKSAVKKVHSGKVNLPDMIADVKRNAFAEYTRLPEAMCDLAMQTLTEAAWDLTSEKDQHKNRDMMCAVLKNAFKSLNITKAIGLGNRKALYEQMCAEFTGDIPYTAYDVASSLMSLPERLEGVHPLILQNLQSAVANAPYIKYFAKEKDVESDDEALTLV